MSTAVEYGHSFPYLFDQATRKSFPGLQFDLSLPGNFHVTAYTRAHLDTGAELSLFDGALVVPTLGIDLMAGPEVALNSAGTFALSARIHRLEISHPMLGSFTLDAAISTVPIARNLLGRDFFEHIQIGFREFHHTFHIATGP